MDKVRLGKTGLMVSRMGFGALPIQSVGRNRARKVIRVAYEQGITFFDTARFYTTSEEDLGQALKDLGERVVIATKSLYRDMEQLEEEFETSFANLQREYIDLYQFHMVKDEEALAKILQQGGPLEFLEKQRRSGRLHHIGITSHRISVLLKALEETDIFETIQVPFNYIENEPLEKLFPLARAKDVGMICMKPIAGGVYRNNRAALKWLLQHSDLVPIPGMCRLEEVEDNLQALSSPLSAVELEGLEADRKELGTVFCRRCDYCMPCPNDIEASFIIRSWLFFKRMGWDKVNMDHVDKFTKGLTCNQCGICAARCPYELPLTEMVIEESKKMLRKSVEMGLITEEQLDKKLSEAEVTNY